MMDGTRPGARPVGTNMKFTIPLQRHRRAAVAALAFAALGTLTLWTTPEEVATAGRATPTQIRKFTFLIHPVSWQAASLENGATNWHYVHELESLRGGAFYRKGEFDEVLATERQVNARQKDYIKRMGRDEALVIIPIGDTPSMRDLITTAHEVLGPRALVLESREPSKDTDYRQVLDVPAKAAMMDEIIESVTYAGYGWTAHGLKVMLYNRMLAHEIRRLLAERGLTFDPATVESTAFGEGFAQCAMSWKSMLAHYLGFAKPIESDYELSVSGMPLLRHAVFKERIALDGALRLFLWQLEDGRSMAFFTQTSTRFADPALFVTLPVRGQIYSEIGGLLNPPPSALFSAEIVKRGPPQYIRMPVFDGRRLYQQWEPPVAQAAYFVSDLEYAKFREAMRSAAIGE
jgi:hypothetical protein